MDDTAAQVAALRAELAALHRHVVRQDSAARVNHMWVRHFVKGLETDPHVQYKVHLWGAAYWLINFPLVCYLFFGLPALWLKLGIFITLMYSIYANLATDYGAMSAAMAAYGEPAPEIPLETHVPDANG